MREIPIELSGREVNAMLEHCYEKCLGQAEHIRNIKDIQKKEAFEVLIHGRIPVMQSTQCLKKKMCIRDRCNTADSFYRMQASVSGEKVETLIQRGAFEKMSSQLLDMSLIHIYRSNA